MTPSPNADPGSHGQSGTCLQKLASPPFRGARRNKNATVRSACPDSSGWRRAGARRCGKRWSEHERAANHRACKRSGLRCGTRSGGGSTTRRCHWTGDAVKGGGALGLPWSSAADRTAVRALLALSSRRRPHTTERTPCPPCHPPTRSARAIS